MMNEINLKRGLVVLLLPLTLLAQTPGDIDSTFGTNGFVTTIHGAGEDVGYSMALQNDGKIVVAGVGTGGATSDFLVMRLNSDGSLDNTFSGDGIATTAIGSAVDVAYSVVIQSDGKIILVGYTVNGTDDDFALVRYDSTGALDSGFGSGGIVTTSFGSLVDHGLSVALQSDDKIVVSGWASNGSNFDFAVARYKTNGTLDSSFSDDGKVITAIGSGEERGYGMTLQPDGKIVVVGWVDFSGNKDIALVRYKTDGTLDSTFSDDGIVTTAVGTGDDYAYSVVIQPDGKIVVAGSANSGSGDDFALVRYNSDGTLDTDFSSDGKVVTQFVTGTDMAHDILLQDDGKILAVGQSHDGVDHDFAIARYDTNGVLDGGFGLGGMSIIPISTTLHDVAFSAALQLDGNIVLAGYGNANEIAVMRILGNESPTIISATPTFNALDVTRNSTVSVNFDSVMDASSIDASSMIVRGQYRGDYTGTYSLVDSVVTFTPDSLFFPGEVITVTLTQGIKSVGGIGIHDPVGYSFTAAVQGGHGTVGPAVDIGSTGGMYGLATADLNDDGIPDLVLVDNVSNVVRIRLGDGDGTFTDGSNYSVGTAPYNVDIADLDGDGAPDLVVANTTTNNVSVLLGNNDGTFATAVPYSGGTQAVDVAIADLDGDGILDLAVVYFQSDAVYILTGDGDGTFTAAGNYPVANGPETVSIADFNGDGYFDLLTPNFYVGNVSVLLGVGDGTFADSVSYLVGTNPNDATIGDFNGDGKLDIATANSGGDNISILLGNGDGTFGTADNTAAPDNPYSIKTTDMNGDGILDLALANLTSSDISILIGAGDGSFATPATYAVSASPLALVAADFDGDGNMDLATANSTTSDYSVFLNTDITAPAIPADLAATAGFEQVSLSWIANTETDLAKYYIYGDSLSASTILIDSVDAPGNTYIVDTLVNNVTYYFRITAADGTGNASDYSTEDSATPVNTPTIAVTDTVDMFEDGNIDITPLVNDVDPDGQTLTIASVTQGANGSAVIKADNITVTFTPATNFFGADSFSYEVIDGEGQETGWVLINVTDINDAPTIVPISDPAAINEDASEQGINLSGISTGAANETQIITITATSSNTGLIPDPVVTYTTPQATGSLAYTPVKNAFGTATIAVRVKDDGGIANGAEDTTLTSFTVTVNAVNDAPAITSTSATNATEDIYFVYHATATDPDSPTLAWTLDQRPYWLLADADSAFGTPLEGALDTSFRVIASDGVLTDTVVVAVTVTPVNDPPEFVAALPDTGFAEDDSLYIPFSTWFGMVDDPDHPDSSLSWDVLGLTTLSAFTDTAGVRLTAPPEWSGSDTAQVLAYDGEYYDTTYLAIQVSPVNDPPEFIAALPDTGFAEDDSLYVPFSAWFGMVDDPDHSNSSLSWEVLGLTTLSVFTETAGVLLQAPPEWSGSDTAQVVVYDGEYHDTTALALFVSPVNDPPVVAHATGITVFEGDTVAVISEALQVLDVDNTNVELHYTFEAQPTELTGEFRLSDVAIPDSAHFTQADIDSGRISFAHDGSETTMDSIGFWITDSAGATAHIAYFSITIIPVNDPPEPFALLEPADGDTAEIANDSLLFVWETSMDIEGDSLVYEFHILGPGYDSTITGLTDTSLVLTGMEAMTLDSLYIWFVEVLDGTDTTNCVADYQFRMPVVLGIDPLALIPEEFALHQNYPNPFNPTTTIQFDLPVATDLRILVYDLLGREVARLANQSLEPGFHQVVWNARDSRGRELPTGMYIILMVTPEFRKSMKVLLLK